MSCRRSCHAAVEQSGARRVVAHLRPRFPILVLEPGDARGSESLSIQQHGYQVERRVVEIAQARAPSLGAHLRRATLSGVHRFGARLISGRNRERRRVSHGHEKWS